VQRNGRRGRLQHSLRHQRGEGGPLGRWGMGEVQAPSGASTHSRKTDPRSEHPGA
jgi:hypothetical protein